MPRRFSRRDVSGAEPTPPKPGADWYANLPPSGPAPDSRRPTMAEFAAGWERVLSSHLPQKSTRDRTPNMDARPLISFDIARSASEWANEVVARANPHNPNAVGSLYQAAITLGTFALYSSQSRWRPELMAPDGRTAPMWDVPVSYQSLVTAQQTTPVRMHTDARGWSALMWGHFDAGRFGAYEIDGGGPSYGQVIHTGLHVLGALAAMPARSGLVVCQEGAEPFGLRPPQDITLAGLEPYPAGVTVPLR